MNFASIDIGTNTVILLIAEINGDRFNTIYNEFRTPRIGKDLKPGGKIREDKINELLIILSDFNKVIINHNCKMTTAIATNAFRIASNSAEIIDLVKNELGLNIEIIQGAQEAEYSYLGAISKYSDQNSEILVIDIGGGSTELILGSKGKIQYKNSFPIGVVIGSERFFIHNPPLLDEINDFNNYLRTTFTNFNFSNPDKTIAIAGTPTTLACIQKGLTIYNEEEVEGSILRLENIRKLVVELSGLSSIQIRNKYKTIVSGREDILLAGTIILSELMNLLKIPEVVVSTRGIRYGVLYKNINNIKNN